MFYQIENIWLILINKLSKIFIILNIDSIRLYSWINKYRRLFIYSFTIWITNILWMYPIFV